MRKLISICAILASWVEAAPPSATSQTRSVKSRELLKQEAAKIISGLPLVFEPNLGQADPRVRFLTRSAGMTSFLTDRENIMVLSRRTAKADPDNRKKPAEIEQTAVRI